MREIKFRAWSEKDKSMYYGRDVDLWNVGESLSCRICLRRSETRHFNEYDVDAIPMQFTGLKDLNGVDIYEGDIDKKGNVFMWSNDLSLFCLHYFNTFNSEWKPSKYPLSKFDQYQVIGNIHEHGHLLK